MGDNINPLSNQLVEKIADLENRIAHMEEARQLYVGDWFELNPNDYEKATTQDNVLVITSTGQDNLKKYFNQGDRLRLKVSGGSYKYFFVGFVVDDWDNSSGNPGIYLYSDDSVIPTGTLENVEIGKVQNPQGHPLYFDYNPTLRDGSTMATLTSLGDTINYNYWFYTLQGNLVTVIFLAHITTTGTRQSIVSYVPIPSGYGENIIGIAKVDASGLTNYDRMAWILGNSPVEHFLEIAPIDTSVSYTGDIYMHGTFTYYIEPSPN